MKPSKLLSCVVVWVASYSFAIEKPAVSQTEFLDLFSSTNSPGEGSLTFSDETEKENITFGLDSGIYGVGLVLKGEWLPETYKKNFSKSLIIQLALGTLKSKLENKVPQFAAATLIGSQLPKEATAYTFKEAGKKNDFQSPQAILYFTSPKTLLAQTDQQKLQNTFFGKMGGVTVTPIGEPEQLSIQTQENKVFFKKQKMKFDFQASLSTPFNGIEKKLTGSIIFPVFTPSGKAGEALALRLSGALEQKNPQSQPEAAPVRNLTGKPEKSSSRKDDSGSR